MRVLILSVVLLVSGCGSCGSKPEVKEVKVEPPPPAKAELKPQTAIEAFLTSNRPRYVEALKKSRGWLDGVKVDPLELRTRGIKGKKKLVEQFDAYRRMYQVGNREERRSLLARIKEVVAVTYEDRYHDMATISDEWFKQDATSYLRAAVLLEKVGLDDTRYREEIKKLNKRLNGQMEKRGPHQQRVFHWYYLNFKLAEPFPLADALQKGVVAQKVDPSTLSSQQIYELTHEVYVLYEYGDRLDVDPFTAEEKVYLRHALTVLADKLIQAKEPDLLAEVVECMHYLRFENEPAYLAGLKFLLETQNADGSWGSYPAERQRLGDFVKQGFELHTTLVAVAALTAAFDRPMEPVGR